MPFGRKTFYNHCLPRLPLVERQFSDIMNKKSELRAFWLPESRFYAYLNFLLEIIKKPTDDKMADARHQSIINLFDTNLAGNLSPEKFDSELRNDLIQEILLLYLAVGGQINGLERYDANDLALILKNDFEFYTDEAMVLTLASIWDEGVRDEEIEMLFKLLPSPSNEADSFLPVDGVVALIGFSALHNLWPAFFGFSDEQRKLFLRNYFFTSIAVGVPVLEWLKIFMKNAPSDLKILEFMAEQISNNQELIPSGNANDLIKFIEVFKRCLAFSKGGDGGFEQEQFLSDFYKGNKNKEAYSQWLRQAFAVLRFVGGRG